jgi:hypothetical protein
LRLPSSPQSAQYSHKLTAEVKKDVASTESEQNTSFGSLKRISAGVLNIDYAEDGLPVVRRNDRRVSRKQTSVSGGDYHYPDSLALRSFDFVFTRYAP